jgi:hypothetical protein
LGSFLGKAIMTKFALFRHHVEDRLEREKVVVARLVKRYL